MYLIFVTNNNIGSIATRLWTLSQYSHVALVHNNRAIEALFWSGVVEESLDDFCRKYKIKKFCRVDFVDNEKAWAFAKAQVGKPYDYASILGLACRTSWHSDKAWMCSELATAAIDVGGVLLIRKSASRVTPEDLLNSPLVIPDI